MIHTIEITIWPITVLLIVSFILWYHARKDNFKDNIINLKGQYDLELQQAKDQYDLDIEINYKQKIETTDKKLNDLGEGYSILLRAMTKHNIKTGLSTRE